MKFPTFWRRDVDPPATLNCRSGELAYVAHSRGVFLTCTRCGRTEPILPVGAIVTTTHLVETTKWAIEPALPRRFVCCAGSWSGDITGVGDEFLRRIRPIDLSDEVEDGKPEQQLPSKRGVHGEAL